MAKRKYKSGLEERVAAYLVRRGIKFKYESERFSYTQVHHYTPDFFLPNGIIVECKGHWKGADRAKHLRIKREHPDVDIRFVFQRDNTLSSKSKTTYTEWCRQHGFKYAMHQIPLRWLKEK